MKAKEHAAKFFDISQEGHFDLEASKGLIADVWQEMQELIKKRKAVRDSSILAILKEQNFKWKAISKLVNERMKEDFLNKDGFEVLIKKDFNIEL